jgi:nucleotide-binding universal stress UspA family protein
MTQTIEHVFAATDLSTHAGSAMQRAALIARAHRARLTILHIVDPAVDDLTPDEARPLVEQQALEIDPRPAIEVGTGAPFVEIIRRARAGGAALIVLGARGEHSLTERLIGTTAERIIRNGDRPVLVVRRPSVEDHYNRVLVGIDRSDCSAEALEFTREAFPGAAITPAYICTVIGEHRLRLSGAPDADIDALRNTTTMMEREHTEAWLAEHDLHADSLTLLPGRPGSDLIALAEQGAFELVAVGSHGMSGLRHLLLGSVAQHVLRDATCDVLVVRRGSSTGKFELP